MSVDELPALPKGWVWARLRDIADIKGGLTKGQKRKPGEICRPVPYLRVANVQRGFLDLEEIKEIDATEKEIEELRLVEGDLLFNEGGDRDKLGRGWVWQNNLPECIHQNHVFRGRLVQPSIQSKFVSWYSNSIGQKYFLEQGKQTTNLASINLTKLGALPVPLPPATEQKRIVEEIEKQLTDLDAGVAALKRVQANLKRYRASVLKAACEGRLVPTEAELARKEGRDYEPADKLLERILQERRAKWEANQLAKMKAAGKLQKDDKWKAKYVEPTSLENSSSQELPAGWVWVSVAQVADIQGGIQKQPSRTPVKNTYPFLRVANVLRGRLDLREVHQIELFGDELKRLRLEKGDLLVVEGNGSSAEIGRMSIWDGSINDCVHQNHIIRLRSQGGVSPDYVAAFWNSPEGNAQVFAQASSTTGLFTLSVRKLSGLSVPLPPLAEQLRIVSEVERILSVVDERERNLAHLFIRAERLRQSILKRAFEGKLVPQDPSDEPASALLDRIRQERAAPSVKSPPGQMPLDLEKPKKPRSPRRRTAS